MSKRVSSLHGAKQRRTSGRAPVKSADSRDGWTRRKVRKWQQELVLVGAMTLRQWRVIDAPPEYLDDTNANISTETSTDTRSYTRALRSQPFHEAPAAMPLPDDLKGMRAHYKAISNSRANTSNGANKHNSNGTDASSQPPIIRVSLSVSGDGGVSVSLNVNVSEGASSRKSVTISDAVLTRTSVNINQFDHDDDDEPMESDQDSDDERKQERKVDDDDHDDGEDEESSSDDDDDDDGKPRVAAESYSLTPTLAHSHSHPHADDDNAHNPSSYHSLLPSVPSSIVTPSPMLASSALPSPSPSSISPTLIDDSAMGMDIVDDTSGTTGTDTTTQDDFQ